MDIFGPQEIFSLGMPYSTNQHARVLLDAEIAHRIAVMVLVERFVDIDLPEIL